ncbi:MAG: hypothetical protein JSW64_00340 [Candidatus Zixiibacteriota bacterium]|nr:MAG: hypothetical protein JSW64_00340 [candidate division Zixibacteria bacterium]
MFKNRPFLRAVYLFFGCWIIGIAVFLILYTVWLRDWQLNWGAADEEIGRYMAGDELHEDPNFNATRAVEIEAPPEEIWPWIVQMGYKRGGFYAFDKLDNAGIPSADSIIPEYQDVKAGDSLTFYQVVKMVPNESALWIFHRGMGGWANATWSWGLYKIDDEHTKLVSRLRQDFSRENLREKIMFAMVEGTEIFMMRTCLLGIKHRAEGN